MSNIVTMHQPNYLPWIGLFSRIKKSDCFIIVDQVQYEAHGVTNRNKIRTNMGWSYLTIPISAEFRISRIKDVTLPPDGNGDTCIGRVSPTIMQKLTFSIHMLISLKNCTRRISGIYQI